MMVCSNVCKPFGVYEQDNRFLTIDQGCLVFIPPLCVRGFEPVISEGSLIVQFFSAFLDRNAFSMRSHIDCFAMACNKDMFDAAGVAYPADGWTFEALLDWGKAFVSGEGARQSYARAKHWVMDALAIAPLRLCPRSCPEYKTPCEP